MWLAGRTPYGVLGVAEGAPFSEVKKAYLRRARVTHPDVPGGDARAFREVQAAFDALKRRAAADERPGRRSRPTPYDAWVIRPRRPRMWTDGGPLPKTSRQQGYATRRPTFSELLAAELKRNRTHRS